MPWHMRTWIFAAALFLAIATLRVFAVEDALREMLRLSLRTGDHYAERRGFQSAIVAAILFVGAMLAGWRYYRVARMIRGRRNIATTIARGCALAMILLLALRLISLHAIDAMLYAGPVRLNWIIDIGASLLVMGSAIAYWRIVRSSR